MLGAQKAANRLCQRMRREDKARWKAEGRAEGRKGVIAQLRARARNNPQLLNLLDEIANHPPIRKPIIM